MTLLKLLLLLLMTAGLPFPEQLLAQAAKKMHAAPRTLPRGGDKAPVIFPVSAQTHRIIYQDTIRVPGASAATLLERFANAYRRNFIFAEYRRPDSPDTTNLLKPRQPAAPGETVAMGTVMLVKPGQEAVYVPGVSPPGAIESYPPIRYLHFALRFHAESGVCYLAVTDFYQRTTTMKRELNRQYGGLLDVKKGQAVPSAASITPPSTPVESLYRAWLPTAQRSIYPATQPTTEPVPTVEDARLLAAYARSILPSLRSYIEKLN